MNLKYERSVKVDSSVHLKIGIFSICILYVRVLDFVCVCGYQFAHQPGRQTGLSSGVMRSARGLWLQISPQELDVALGPYHQSRCLRSVCAALLFVPRITRENFCRPSSAQAPLLGNSLVYSI